MLRFKQSDALWPTSLRLKRIMTKLAALERKLDELGANLT